MMLPSTPGTPARCPVGVVIPTYNRPDVLRLCLKHLEQQTWKDFEVLVVDDGSAHATYEILKGYASTTPLAFRYVRQQNSGPARARNLGLSLLRSEICLFIGDDILASPKLVEDHLAFHRQHPAEEDAALGLTRWNEQGQHVTPFMRWLDSGGVQFAYGELLNGETPNWRHFYTSNLSVKTELLRQHPFNESFRKAAMEDMELAYRLEQQGMLRLSFLPGAVAEHLHPTSVEQACLRMLTVGAAVQRFGELWPEHSVSTTATGPLKTAFYSLITNKRWALPRLRDAAALLTRVWCPNPLLRKVLLMHYLLGRQKAAANSDFQCSSQNNSQKAS